MNFHTCVFACALANVAKAKIKTVTKTWTDSAKDNTAAIKEELHEASAVSVEYIF